LNYVSPNWFVKESLMMSFLNTNVYVKVKFFVSNKMIHSQTSNWKVIKRFKTKWVTDSFKTFQIQVSYQKNLKRFKTRWVTRRFDCLLLLLWDSLPPPRRRCSRFSEFLFELHKICSKSFDPGQDLKSKYKKLEQFGLFELLEICSKSSDHGLDLKSECRVIHFNFAFWET